jgi:hypothetical protein
MSRLVLIGSLVLIGMLRCGAVEVVDDPPEPFFKPGEYGDDPLPGTESLVNLRLSPDGSQVAVIRQYTPESFSDPRYQLWIVNRDGSNPRLIGVNILGVDWHPSGKRLALTVAIGLDFFVYTLDLETGDTVQWTGGENQFFNKPTVSLPLWFNDGERLLVSVFAKAFEQPFERGIYTINTRTREIRGPLVVLMQGAFLGNHEQYVIGTKYTFEHDPRDGNAARYDFDTRAVTWLTSFPTDSLVRYIDSAIANPVNELVVQSRYVENAWQLFLMNAQGTELRQITRLGGDAPWWHYGGQSLIFRRDVYKGIGARYVPFIYEVDTDQETLLWPNLPDSLPVFPPLSTQQPMMRRSP